MISIQRLKPSRVLSSPSKPLVLLFPRLSYGSRTFTPKFYIGTSRMWRSKAGVCLLKSVKSFHFTTQNKVFLSTVLVPTPPPCFTPKCEPSWGFPRFFSDSSAAAIPSTKDEGFGEEDCERVSFFEEDSSEKVGARDVLGVETKNSGGLEDSIYDGVESTGVFVEETEIGEGKEAPFASDGEGDVEEDVVEVDNEKVDSILSVLQNAVEESITTKLDELEDLVLSKEVIVRVLQNRAEISAASLIAFFRWAFKRSDLINSGIVDLLVQEVCGTAELTSKDALALWDFVREIGQEEKGLVSVGSLNQLIASFGKLGSIMIAVEVFHKFEDLGCVHDGDTYYTTICVLGKRSWADKASAVCNEMISLKRFPDEQKVGRIINFFCKGGKAKNALSVYLMAKENGVCAPATYLEFLVDHLAKKDDTVLKGLELLDDCSMQSQSPFLSVISGLYRIKDTKNAKKLLDRMIELGTSPRLAIFNIAITAFVKAGEMEDAVALLKVMENLSMKPDIRAYNVIMSGFAKGGLMDDAVKIFHEAKKMHPKLGRVSYHILTQGYNRINEFESALKWMNAMKEEGLQPNVDEYRKMVQSLCLKALDWRTAEKLVEEMKENGLRLDGHTCGLIGALRQLEGEEMRSATNVAKI